MQSLKPFIIVLLTGTFLVSCGGDELAQKKAKLEELNAELDAKKTEIATLEVPATPAEVLRTTKAISSLPLEQPSGRNMRPAIAKREDARRRCFKFIVIGGSKGWPRFVAFPAHARGTVG